MTQGIEAPAAVVVFSGGQDSTTCLYQAAASGQYRRIHALTIDYGQRHRVEVQAALDVLAAFRASEPVKQNRVEITHEVVSLPAGILESTSPLVNKAEEVETYADAESLPGGIEKTFVPMRNLLFLTIAANRAVAIGAHHVITGVSQADYGGYPDCRSSFISQATQAMRAACDLPFSRLTIITPLMQLSKAATVKLAAKIPDCFEGLAFSHTCYQGQVPPCGSCHACLLRAKGFEEAGLPDPLVLRTSA